MNKNVRNKMLILLGVIVLVIILFANMVVNAFKGDIEAWIYIGLFLLVIWFIRKKR